MKILWQYRDKKQQHGGAYYTEQPQKGGQVIYNLAAFLNCF